MTGRSILLPMSLVAGLLAGCPQEIGPVQGTNEPAEDPYACCDPDDPFCICEGYWHCTEGFDSAKHCVQQNPDLPDEGNGWDCTYAAAEIVCTGTTSEHPDAGQEGGWTCETQAEFVVCSRDSEQADFPEDGGASEWNCLFEDGSQSRVCDQPGDDIPDGGDWECETTVDGDTVCRTDSPEQPDGGGEWDCYRVREDDGEEHDYCVGNEMPDGEGTNGFNCEDQGEFVVCENGDGQIPDGGGSTEWQCDWGETFLECESEGGETPPTDDCECVEGASRFCDEPTFCNWGRQTCEERAGERRWSACLETSILNGCEPNGRFAQDYEWHYRGGFWDGRIHDPNNDGVLLMPPDNWYNPAAEDCALRQGECVQDMWDLDNDGDNDESTGDCQDIQVCQ